MSEENDEPKENKAMIQFGCSENHFDTDCVYSDKVAGAQGYRRCKYYCYLTSQCTSKVAQVNAAVMFLKSQGIEVKSDAN